MILRCSCVLPRGERRGIIRAMTDEEYLPQKYEEPIPHYHGDVVRQLFIVTVILMVVGAPFYTETLRTQLPFMIAGALVLAALAALANPHKKWVFLAGAVAAGLGFVVYETWALYQYATSSWLEFILREVIAVTFLVAFYFSMKTVRAFMLRKVGRHDEAGEFDA